LIAKELPMPLRLILTEILFRRLILGHSKYHEVESNLAKRRAGYWGEIILSNYMKKLPPQKYLIFHDLQLEIHGVHFQIDTLLISRSYNLIIEAKNISGTLIFDSTFNQLFRIQDNKKETFEDPRIQAKWHQTLLQDWFTYHGLTQLPIETLVFFANVKTTLKTVPGDKGDFSKVCKARDVFYKINAYEKVYHQEKVGFSTISEIGNLLLSNHSPQKIDILGEYKLQSDDIRTGPRCPTCFHIPMIYVKGKGHCPKCQTTSKEAFKEGISDFFYLYKPTITNSECRDFLHLPSNNIAQKLLQSLNLKTTGNTKSRIYHQPIEKVIPCDLLQLMES
jgi:hypothetical protein